MYCVEISYNIAHIFPDMHILNTINKTSPKETVKPASKIKMLPEVLARQPFWVRSLLTKPS